MYTLNKLNELNQESLFENFFNQVSSNKNLLSTNIVENENGFTLEVEVPGIKKENIKLSFEKGYLTIQATSSKKEGKFLQKERYYGTFTRQYYLDEVDEDSITANLEDGILTININKAKETKQKFIEIK